MDNTDAKLYGLNLTALFASLTSLEPVLKIVLLLLSIGYTALRIHSHLTNKDNTKK
jgi:hypothetical protein